MNPASEGRGQASLFRSNQAFLFRSNQDTRPRHLESVLSVMGGFPGGLRAISLPLLRRGIAGARSSPGMRQAKRAPSEWAGPVGRSASPLSDFRPRLLLPASLPRATQQCCVLAAHVTFPTHQCTSQRNQWVVDWPLNVSSFTTQSKPGQSFPCRKEQGTNANILEATKCRTRERKERTEKCPENWEHLWNMTS